ncbi:outer membrane protein assembly factor BamD [Legionella spiritensis]|uniref:outer membrane protein assembly factor BamD n=1 Tax=Legionella spiritensis TaxID=452 RepID=UPI000F6D9995|nr:outer membrane protein assembly factor BamD [Legionella spiritensis]VEG90470.1 competence lipoprotein ComL [Legionella spiritensis]
MKRLKVLLLLSLLISMTACSLWGNRDDEDDNSPYKGMTAKQLFTESKDAIAKEQYQSAIKKLEAMESMYPFSDYAEQAQLDLVYAYYKNSDYASAAATSERFIHLYPRAKSVDYAYYMKGLANFQQTRGTFARLMPLDESWRDPGTQSQAYADFATLIQKFPNSRYKADSLQRMIYLRNMFAERELNTSNYYFERKMFVAAAERANFLIKNYPQAPSVKPALVLLYKSNKAMGLNKAAEDALAVYRATYPNQPMDTTG